LINKRGRRQLRTQKKRNTILSLGRDFRQQSRREEKDHRIFKQGHRRIERKQRRRGRRLLQKSLAWGGEKVREELLSKKKEATDIDKELGPTRPSEKNPRGVSWKKRPAVLFAEGGDASEETRRNRKNDKDQGKAVGQDLTRRRRGKKILSSQRWFIKLKKGEKETAIKFYKLVGPSDKEENR